MKTRNWKTYALWVLATEAVGGLAGLLIRKGVQLYEATAVKPALTPPAIVFPIAWTILYALMGFAAARIALTPPGLERKRSLRLYLLQLGFNFAWSLLFFVLRAYGFSFFWLAALWVLIVRMSLSFWELDRTAAWLQLPYLLWVLFAAYLNLGVWKLN